MGHDTTVIAGTPVNFHVLGKDSLGTIAKRELKVGNGPYLNLSKQDTSLIIPGDSGSVTCVGRVTDDDGNSDEDTMVVTLKVPSKSNNDLAGLVASAGTLSPAFKPVTLLYALQVAYADSQVAITASTSDPQAELAVNGKPVGSGKPSDAVDVKVGTTQNVFSIVVTAQDGTQKAYGVSVTRLPSTDTRLSKLEPSGFILKPGFVPAVLDYADTVAFAVSAVSLKPTVNHPAAKVSVNDSVVVSGSSSKDLALIVGDNLIKVEVTAQDGKTKGVYNVKVVRRAKLIVSRALGAASAVLSDSLEAPLGTAVTLTGKDTTGFHFVKWTVTEGTGTLQDSAANPGKLTLKSATVRATGNFLINTYAVTSTIKGFVGGAFEFPDIAIEHGKDTTIRVTPLVGYRVLSLTDNGNPVSTLGAAGGFGVRTFKLVNVTAKHDIEATFLKTYTLTSSVTGDGLISPIGAIEVDSNSSRTYTLTSNSPGTGVWVSAFTDNAADQVAALTGDRMTASSYALTAINANHTIAATFAIKTFLLKVTGHDLCIRKVTTCTDPRLCVTKLCLVGSGPDADTITAQYGSKYNISTDDSLGTRPFVNFQKDGAVFSTSTSITTDPITADVTYAGTYKLVIKCCPGVCCTIITDPPVIIGSESSPISQENSYSPLLQSKEPVDEN
jgi:hypothetical protein